MSPAVSRRPPWPPPRTLLGAEAWEVTGHEGVAGRLGPHRNRPGSVRQQQRAQTPGHPTSPHRAPNSRLLSVGCLMHKASVSHPERGPCRREHGGCTSVPLPHLLRSLSASTFLSADRPHHPDVTPACHLRAPLSRLLHARALLPQGLCTAVLRQSTAPHATVPARLPPRFPPWPQA